MKVEGYDLHCYCDNEDDPRHGHDEFPHKFFGDNKQYAYREARRAGWVIGQRDYCPKCSGKPNRESRAEGTNVMDVLAEHRKNNA